MRFLRQTLLSVCLILPCAIGIAQPNAQNDSYSIQEDATPTPYDILVNDTDPTFGLDVSTVDLEPATPVVDQGPINTLQGTFAVDVAGNLTFAPIADFHGTVVRQYTVKNNESPTPQTSNEATVSVTVMPVNDPPTIGIMQPITIAEDAIGGTGEITLPIGDIDTPLSSLSLSGVSDNTALVDAGGIVFSGDKVTITPLPNQFGTANITIEVEDDEDETDSGVLVLTVTSENDAPVALDDSRSTNEDTNVTWNLVANDSDIDGTITDVDLNPATPGVQATFSNLAGEWIIAAGEVTYDPASDYTGPASISYTAIDNGNSASNIATASVMINSINDLPTISPIMPVSIDENTTTGPITLVVSDVETPVASLIFTPSTNNPTLVPLGGIAFSGNEVTITPQASQFGTANIAIEVKDTDGGTDSEILALTVTAIADPPVAVNDNTVTTEDINVSYDVIANDSDPDGTITGVDLDPGTPGTQATFTNAAGTWTVASGVVTFDNVLNYAGPASVSYVAIDNDGLVSNTATFTVAITPVNDLPTIDINPSPTLTILEDGTGSVALTVTDVETPVASLTYSRVTSNATLIPLSGIVITGTTLTITPLPNQFGTANITITVDDGNSGTDQVILALTVTSQNDAPVAVNDNASTTEDVNVSLNVTTNDSDSDGTITGVDLDPGTPGTQTTFTNAAGTWTVASGVVTFDNVLNYAGPASVSYVAIDNGTAVSAPATFTVAITPVNDLPTIDINPSPTLTILEDGTGSVTLTVTDVETPVASLTYSRVTSNATLIPLSGIVITGTTLTITPLPNQFGTANITITVDDGNSGTDQVILALTVTSQNDAPVAVNDNASTNEDVNVSLNVTTNDSDSDGTITGVDLDPGTPGTQTTFTNAAGTWTVASGVVTFDNVLNYAGPASVSYVAIDNGTAVSAPATFTVAITPVNDLPTIDINPSPTLTILEDGTGSVALTVTDVETPVASLTYSRVTSNATLIPLSGIVITGTTLTITPLPNQFGTANITITVDDGNSGTDQVILALTVTSQNDAPVAVNDNASTNEDVNVSLNVTTNDSDSDGTITGVDLDPGTSGTQTTFTNAAGTWTVASGVVTFDNVLNYAGPASVSYVAIDNDGLVSNTATFTVAITPVNDLPTIDINPSPTLTILEDGTGSVTLTVTDVETPVASLTYSRVTSNATLIPLSGIVITGTTLTITPLPNQFGTANITITVDDGNSGTDQVILALTVTSQNDAPVAVNDNASTNEDVNVSLNVTTNDSDSDGTITGVDLDPGTPGTQTTFTNAAGTWTVASGVVTFDNVLNYAGPASVSYVAIDNDGLVSNTATFTVAITPVNDPPTITAIGNQAIAEDTPTAALAFTIGDIDTPVGSLTVTGTSNATTVIPNANIVITGTGASRTVTLTPAPDQSGLAVITLTVSDGTTNVPMSFAVTVNPVSDPPTITAIPNQLIDEDSNTGALPFTIGDIDNPAGTLALAAGSSNLTLVPIANIVFGGSGANRTVTVTPAADQTGVAIITITVGDGTTAVPTSFQVTVDGFNDPPTISAISNQSTSEDVPTAAIPFTVGDPETPAADLTVTASSDNVGIIPNANIIVAGSGASRTVQVTPEPNQSGAAIITLTVSDGVNSTPISFQVTVNTVDDAPTITTIPNQTINEDTQTTALAFVINDVETPIPSLTVTSSSNNVALVPPASIVLAGSGANYTIQVTPLPNQFGTAVITVSVNDGTNTTSTTFQLNVTSVNDLPTITAITDRTVNEDTSTGALSFTITDIETPLASLTVTGNSDNTTLVPVANIVFVGSAGTRTVTVTPAANQTGVATLTITVNDGTANVSTTFQVTVNPVNDAPVITGQTLVSTTEEEPLDIEFSHITVTDVDNIFPTDFTLTVLANPGYSFVGNTITPNLNVTGNITVRVQVRDGALNSNIYNLQVTVNPINDPPVITGQSALTILEDTPLTFLLSHLTIVDPDNASGFTFVLGTTGSNYSVSGGNLITPAAHFNGTLSIPVTVSDGTNVSAPYNLQIQVTPVNDKPQITGQTPISIAEVQPVTIDLSQLTVFDPDNNFPADFVLTISTGPNYSAVGNVVTPVVNFSGTLLVRIKVSDGLLESDYYDFQILVNSTNDPPVITGQRPLNTEENEPLQIQFVDLTVSDPDNTYPTGFTLTILPGTTYTFSGTTVTPNPNVSGMIDVRVKVNDGAVDSAPYLLKIDVNSVNDAPVITGQLPMTALEDAPVINMSMGFLIISDPDSPISGFTMTVSPGAHYTLANGVEITPDANFYGTLSVPVKVNDGSLDSQPYNVQIQISPVNDAPTITGQNPLSAVEDQGIILKLEDFLVADIDNTFPAGFTLQVAQGSFPNYDALGTTVTPKDNFTGTLGVAVTVSDGAATSGTYSAAIVVGTINDRPTIDPIGNITIQEDPEAPSVISLTGITAGVGEGGTQLVTVTISTSEPDWFDVFEVTYPGSTLGTIRIKPKADSTGTAHVTVRVQDDGLATPPHVNFYEYTFDFTIDPVNDPPSFTSQPLKLAETAQGFEYSIKVGDVENQALTITAPTLPTWLILTQGSNGQATLSGIPPLGTTGEVSVVIVASDPTGSVSTQEFKIVVNGRPTITPFAINTDEDEPYEFKTEFASNYNDPDGNPIVKIKIKQLPTKGKLFLGNTLVSLGDEIPANPITGLSYIPSTDSNGTDIIKWNATDGIYYSHVDANIVVSILPFNDPPEVIALEAPETDTLQYELGSESPVKLTSIFDARDPEGDNIIAAEIGFQISTDYQDGKDIFSFRDTLGIVGAFIEELGVLTLTGKASVEDYVAAIRTVRYNYLDAVPDDHGLNRKVSIRLNDGNFGGTKERLIGLIYTNPGLDIANAFTPNGDDDDNKYWRIYSPAGLERYKDALIRVYDKRGALVYQATGFSTPWYGEGPEGVLPADSYYYTIDLRYDKKKYKGVVTILR